MNSANPYAPPRRQNAKGMPPAMVLFGVGIAVVLGAYLGRSTAPEPPPAAEPEPVATVALADLESKIRTIADPELVDELNACETQNEKLLSALEEAGGETERFRRGLERAVETLNSQEQRNRSAQQRPSSAPSAKPRSKPRTERRTRADVRTWTPRIEQLGSSPDFRVWGKIHNLEDSQVEGVLQITLVNQDGITVDTASLQMILEPGLNPWDHIFRWPPSDNYKPRVSWETLRF